MRGAGGIFDGRTRLGYFSTKTFYISHLQFQNASVKTGNFINRRLFSHETNTLKKLSTFSRN